MDRVFLYPNAQPLVEDHLNIQVNVMKALGYALKAVFGTSPVVDGLACTPGTGLSVNISAGSITAYLPVDSNAFGVLGTNTTNILKIGCIDTVTNFAVAAPSSAGQSVNILICAALSEVDGNAEVLSYYNAANPAQPLAGPANAGTEQFTTRAQTVALQAIRGAAATTGQQVTPAAPNGYTPLWIITVNYGQSSISSGNIAQAPNVPWANSQFLTPNSGYATETWVEQNFIGDSSLSMGAVGSSVAQRNADGSLTAAAFHGQADTAAQATNANYATTAGTAANTNHANFADVSSTANNAVALGGMSVQNNPVANSIPQRDGNGDINCNQLNGTATQALNAQTLQNYSPSVSSTASTVAVRDGAGGLSATTFNGVATSAEWADFAERFATSEAVEPGDLVQLGGSEEICLANASTGAFSVVSTNPAYLANEKAGTDATHPPICLSGRVPTKVIGRAAKGDWLIPSTILGVALATDDPAARNASVGRAIEDKKDDGIGKVMAFVRARV